MYNHGHFTYVSPRSKMSSKAVRTPDDISRDVRGMKLRQRVSATLDDDLLREDLEEIILERVHLSAEQIQLRAYKDIAVLTGNGVKAISDIRGSDTLSYSKADRVARCKLAAVYRLLQLFGWGEGVFDHTMCTLQVSDDEPSLLVGPHGLLFSEITASSLVQVSSEGEVIHNGSTNLGMYKPVLDLHLAIHSARQDGKCLIFLNTEAVKAVAATSTGLLPISHDAIAIGEVSYHSFPGFSITEDVKESLSNELGASNKVMILHNFGAICLGETVEETFHTAFFFVKACENQVRAMRMGLTNLLTIERAAQGHVLRALDGGADENANKQKMATAHFEAWMHWLDSQGYKTDYNYSNPELFRKENPASPVKDVQRSSARPKYEYRSGRGTGQSSPVKATRYKREITEPDMTELDFKENWDLDDERTGSARQPGIQNGFEQEKILQPGTVEEQRAAVDFNMHEPEGQGSAAAEKTPDVSPGFSRRSSDGSTEPEEVLVRRRSGKKVKKRRSFGEKLVQRISKG